jgi:hypothetical protein
MFANDGQRTNRSFLTEIYPSQNGDRVQFCVVVISDSPVFNASLTSFPISLDAAGVINVAGTLSSSITLAGNFNNSAANLTPPSLGAMLVIGTTSWLFAKTTNTTTFVLAFDVFTLTTTMTAPFGLTVAPLAGGTFLRSENGLFLRYTSSVYRFQRDGVASLNNLVGLATGAPSASAFCNDDLILSAKNIDAPGFYYIVLSDLSNGKPIYKALKFRHFMDFLVHNRPKSHRQRVFSPFGTTSKGGSLQHILPSLTQLQFCAAWIRIASACIREALVANR